jgi:nucleoside-diphosphate-sugar epimerase
MTATGTQKCWPHWWKISFGVGCEMQPVSIVGCGYTGRRLAERLRNSGAHVRGFATSAASLQQIAALGVDALQLDLDASMSPIDFTGHLVYYSVPPARNDGDARLVRFLESLGGAPKRLVYLSTTGVYGDQAGATVNEDTAPAPRTERAIRRMAAETALRGWADSHDASWCILRIAGIYGPGRLPLERLRRGVPSLLPQDATPGNRIHVTDLVTACVAAGFAAAADRRIYNVTDGSDHTVTDYLQRVARLARLPSPPLVSRAEAERTVGESRRVDNGRMLKELGVELEYRDLDAGIGASLEEPRP